MESLDVSAFSVNSVVSFRFSRKRLDFAHHSIKLADEIGMVAILAKRGDKRAVIPKRAVLLARKPLEHFQAVSSKFGQNRARVMQLIGR